MNRVLIILAVIFPLSGSCTSGATSVVAGSRLRGAVEAFVGQQPLRPGEELRVEYRALPDSVEVPDGPVSLTVDPSSAPVLRGYVALAVEVSVSGKCIRRVLVQLLVHTFAPALMATRFLDAHSVIGRDDVRVATLETTQWKHTALGSPDDLAGRRTRRIIPEGGVLYEDFLEEIPLVKCGDHVMLKAASKRVNISADAIALEDGRAGKIINVKTAYSRERVKARVLDSGVVETLEQ
ncbi:MAG TPA: flagellar basal body P-ring formation chaperone FlgA [Bacteroidota bacterium]|nr:flagellar basal body P-ring formation chaperone FlgA [Bacteroidota bacterium]